MVKNFISQRATLILIFIMSVVPIMDLLHPGLPITHDGQDHVARIANFYQSLKEGTLIPRWAGNLNWGYGHPILMFLYPLPSYLASLFHFIGFSLTDSLKLVFGLGYAASILAMYYWLKEKWGTEAGLVGGLLYGYAPYRFVDMYVRGAIGEHVAFIFPPLIFWGIDRLRNNKKNAGILIAFSTAGLILSHNAVSLMFLPLIALYIVYSLVYEAKNRINFFLLPTYYLLLGFLISAFFWIPAFFEGKYTLRDIVTTSDYTDRFVPFMKFLVSGWNYGGGNEFSKELGVVNVLAIVSAIAFTVRAKDRKIKMLFIGLLGFLIGTVFLMTRSSIGIWQTVGILQKFQFPWRFLSITTFTTAVLGAFVLSEITRKKRLIVVVTLSVLLIVSTHPMWRASGYGIRPEEFYEGVYPGTTDTGESSPIWSVRFMEHSANAPIEVVSGTAEVAAIARSFTKHRYTIIADEKSQIVEHTLYFPGWNVFIDGIPVSVEFQNPSYRGLMTFWVESGRHTVDVVFSDTKVRTASHLITGMSLLLMLGLYAISRRRLV